MKQVININFQGRVVPIEATAFDILKNYTDSLNKYFVNEQGKDEIINDIESRISELFQEQLKTGATCITEEDVHAIIRSMGRPEDFDEAEADTSHAQDAQPGESHSQPNFTFGPGAGNRKLYRDENNKVLGGVCSGIANYFGIDAIIVRVIFAILLFSGIGFIAYLLLWVVVPSTASTEIGGQRRKLYRDNDHKIIAGVCAGLGSYFGVPVWLPRLLFLIPFLSFAFKFGHWGIPNFISFSFSPGSLIIYIILWLVIPEALTTSEKLEMKGEKVDMNSIKNSVMEEMQGVKERAQKLSKEAATFAREKSKTVASDIHQAAHRSGRSLGDIIALLFKIFFYFIAGSIAIALIVGLFGLGIAAVGIFPLKDFVLNGTGQNLLAWGTLVFFIAVPIIGIITWLIRRITRVRKGSAALTWIFICLWILGWACFIGLVAGLSKDFKKSNSPQEIFVSLANPHVNKLEITAESPFKTYHRRRWNRLDLFEALDSDSIFVQNVTLQIIKTQSDSFRLSVMKLARGRSLEVANNTAAAIPFKTEQQDSILIIDKGFAITPQQKFRNQEVIVRIYVPVGKQIRIDESIGWFNVTHVSFFNDEDWDWDFDSKNTQHNWERNTDYIMKEDGLYTLDGIKADTPDEENNSWRNGSRRRNTRIKINENGVEINEENGQPYRYDENKITIPEDSIKLDLKMQQQKLKDSLLKVKEKTEQELKKLNAQKEGGTAFIGTIITGFNSFM